MTHSKRGVARVLAGLFLSGLAGPASAQGSPAFELQPGISIADFVSVPEGTASSTAFSLRLTTRFPMNRWINPVVGAVFLPWGSTGASNRNTDAPTLFAGNVLRLVGAAQTGGWVAVELPVLVNHAPAAGPSGTLRDYGRDLVILPTLVVRLGSRGLGELGTLWSRLEVVMQVEQNLTPNRDPLSGERDRLNPVATFGVSFNFGTPSPDA